MFGRSPHVRHWPWIVALLAVTTVAFLPIVRNDFVNYDDPFTLQHNDRLLSPGVLQWAFTTALIGHYQPLAWVGWASVAALFGTNPSVFHALSLAVHLIDTVLIYLLSMRLALCAGFAPVEQRTAGIVAAGAFAIHPMRVEVVAWASAFPYTLSLAWLLASALAYMRYAATTGAAARIAFGASLGCYACSLMSRGIGLGFPLLLLALDVWPLRRRNSLFEKLPFLSLAALSTVVEAVSRESTGLEEVGLGARLTAATWSPFAYLSRMLWPIGYSPIEVRPLQPRLEWTPMLLGAVGLTVVSLAVWRWRHRLPAAGVAWASF